jgi:sulfur-oxidizing protein SoxA
MPGALGTPPPAADPRRSSYHAMSRATQAMQDDDTQNPSFLWVADGERRFAQDCRRCHTAASLRDVAVRYPVFDATRNRPIGLGEQLRQCHTRPDRAAQPASEDALLALEAYLARQGRGQPIAAPTDPRLAPWREQGARLWQQRLGQLALACADCHDRLAGQRLAGSTIPQGHPTGYPVYRLSWEGLGTLQRRLRGCLTAIRAEPFAPDAPEWLSLELHLKARAAGLPLESPAVRP